MGRENRNGPGPSRNGLTGENINLMRILKNMTENKQKQTELLPQGLLVAPKGQRPRNVSDFRRLQPAGFSGVEKPLDVKQ